MLAWMRRRAARWPGTLASFLASPSPTCVRSLCEASSTPGEVRYWLAPGILLCLVVAVLGAWVLLIEILR